MKSRTGEGQIINTKMKPKNKKPVKNKSYQTSFLFAFISQYMPAKPVHFKLQKVYKESLSNFFLLSKGVARSRTPHIKKINRITLKILNSSNTTEHQFKKNV